MLFNSAGFGLFVAALAIVFHAVPARLRTWVTLVGSYVYYATFGLPPCALLLGASVVAWLAARRIRRGAVDDRGKVRVVGVAVVLLLGALALFKYARTMTGGAIGLVAPVGISYYTFKLVSYVVDTYWERIETEHDLFAVLRYAAFFPQILSGPIQRPDDFFRQEKQPLAAEVPMMRQGLRLVLFGLFQKLVVADRAALLVDQVNAHPSAHPAEVHWLVAYVYAIQLYADFSGLTDIALGTGCLFGVRGPPNFENPYYAPTIQDFWRRWHMSLSSWLGDYVFTPLRMALRGWGKLGLVVAITINMIAIGVWHGPMLTFVAFGVINAVYMSVSALTLPARNKWLKKRPALARVHRIVGAVVVFNLMVIAFIPFRAESLGAAWFSFGEFVRGFLVGPRLLAHPSVLLRTTDFGLQQLLPLVFGVAVMEAIHLARGSWVARFDAMARWQRWLAYYALMAAIVLFALARTSSFIYFKF